jgi:hypothetical protein
LIFLKTKFMKRYLNTFNFWLWIKRGCYDGSKEKKGNKEKEKEINNLFFASLINLICSFYIIL